MVKPNHMVCFGMIILILAGMIGCETTELVVPSISVSQTEYCIGDTIEISFSNTNEKDWIGFYEQGVDPGISKTPLWGYAEGTGSLSFDLKGLEVGSYWICLCENDGYGVIDRVSIEIYDSDRADYGARDAKVLASMENGYRNIEVEVYPSSPKELTYVFCWSREGKRLENYLPLDTVTYACAEQFTVRFNECIFMPEEADGIEVAVQDGDSHSIFIPADDTLKLGKSTLLLKFGVLTDLHISENYPTRDDRLAIALEDVFQERDISAIFTCGDNTHSGSKKEYEILLDTVQKVGGNLPAIYYAMGNHDVGYNSQLDFYEEVELYKEYTKMSGIYYRVEINGYRFIVLGTDDANASDRGEISATQLDWLRKELKEVAPQDAVFIFLHQPLMDTVSGSLYSLDEDHQKWYGVPEAAETIRTLLKDYPNAILFTGHTHYSLESEQPMYLGKGSDANYVNAASIGYLWDNNGAVGGSEGYFVEVYEDYILLRGRDFLKGKWCAAAQFYIPILDGSAK